MAADASSGRDAPAERGTVFVVDDDRDLRELLATLAQSVGLHARLFASAAEFLDAYDDGQTPGCLVLDVRMPGMNGPDLQRQLLARDVHLPTIFVSGHGEIRTAIAAIRAGAVDFIQKPFSPQALLDRIHEALALDQQQRRNERAQRELDARLAALTERQREVMRWLVVGEPTKSIGLRLGISPKTVDNHRTKILEKMGVDNTTQLTCLVGDAGAPARSSTAAAI